MFLYFIFLVLAFFISISVQAQTNLGPLLFLGEVDAKFCGPAAAGEVCRMNQYDALAACLSLGRHLPTTREFAELSVARGAKGFKSLEEFAALNKADRAGYYKVENLNPGEREETFYFNHSGYVTPEGGPEGVFEPLWTASVVPSHQDYAHVFYPTWGGGGGDPRDHKRDHLNGARHGE